MARSLFFALALASALASFVIVPSVAMFPSVAMAQEDEQEGEGSSDEASPGQEDAPAEESEPAPATTASAEISADVKTVSAGTTGPASSVEKHIAREHRPGAATYQLSPDKVWAPMVWDGGRLYAQTEIDVGYATYEYPSNRSRPRETLHDLRGRFVLGPMFERRFGASEYSLNVFGQLVAWIREQDETYQINVDDVYVQFGHGTDWDLQVGRFMTWRVFHKGLGFDLYTLEDNGASRSFPIANGDFAVHTYEVDYIFLRNSPYVNGEVAGRAAFHYYPLDVLGFELAAAYGLTDNQGTNTLGGRLAADLQWEFLRLSAAGEYREQNQTGPPSVVQNPGTPQEVVVACPKCGASYNYGFGGGMVLKFAPVELGVNAAKGRDQGFAAVGDAQGVAGKESTRSGDRLSYGGYLELDPGSLVMQRPLILGAGANRTEFVQDNNHQQFHLQAAGYVAFPLGVNNAMLKLVFSYAGADLFTPEGAGGAFTESNPTARTVRVRFSSDF